MSAASPGVAAPSVLLPAGLLLLLLLLLRLLMLSARLRAVALVPASAATCPLLRRGQTIAAQGRARCVGRGAARARARAKRKRKREDGTCHGAGLHSLYPGIISVRSSAPLLSGLASRVPRRGGVPSKFSYRGLCLQLASGGGAVAGHRRVSG